MAQAILQQVLHLAERLSASERVVLIRHLLEMSGDSRATTLEDVRAEHERRKVAGVFTPTISLMGKYAQPGVDLSFDTIQSAIHDSAAEWEHELDEFSDDPD